MKPIESAKVARAFGAYPAPMRKRLLALRTLILDTAAATEGVGKLEEAVAVRDVFQLPDHSG
jgi:hypothetical protein